MRTELSNNGKRVYDVLTDDMQTINQISKKTGMNWHTTARELAILLVMDRVDVFIIKKVKLVKILQFIQ